ncbi:DUF4091 domain-containing protein [Fulvivirgaceae bacterium BMA12]|uniref:DUF4091 domain-containing protein n=1 Tax=Agaribacillus aureus TaxID=3051825 RepID=A0ABT8L125_9BACT|nr:DUF4091 domain-containing protein [Fulvivirgaceae bacterium BMA12]
MMKFVYMNFAFFLLAVFVISACGHQKKAEIAIQAKKENEKKYLSYEEPADPDSTDLSEWHAVTGLKAGFGNVDTRYTRSQPPAVDPENLSWTTYAWKGERVHTQLLLWSDAAIDNLRVEWQSLKNADGGEISSEYLKARFVRYLLTDEFAEGCGYRKPEDFKVALVADAIDEVGEMDLKAKTTRPIWVSVDVPRDVPAGSYQGKLMVYTGDQMAIEGAISVTVANAVLPSPSEWDYHLDLWQNPYAVARFHDVALWSEEHLAYMKPLLSMLADAGQKVITTSLIDKPWNGQTEDPFGAMINWTKLEDGNWEYDYTIFDKWVAFSEQCGITRQINCYSMIPWGNKFFYFDQAKNSRDSIIAEPGSEAYAAHWKPFLLDFAKHLREKNWFDKTTIAMDERPMEAMQGAINLVKSTVPEMKVSLAGAYHEEIQEAIYDLCIASGEVMPKAVMENRISQGKPTTYYTCCVEPYPNNFTFSPPAESTWQAWHAAHKGYTGYLRWAYNSWVKDPLLDSRFRSWPAGDTYMVYPEARTSIRFERMREGIQDYVKIALLRKKLENSKETTAGQHLETLNEHLRKYEISALENNAAGNMINEGKSILRKISETVY